MATQALYLKWRPQRFEDVVGQEHVTQTLKNALRSGRIAHAYLFAGPRGTGKTTMARLLAKAVNCLDEEVSNRPCNRCVMCRSINEGRLLDLIEIDAASHTGVDNVREAIRDKVGFRPTEARYKVYVIDEVHMLSTSAFNALLKTLEEPPEHVIFCLATTEPHKVLPTILSRCQQFDFHRISLRALVSRLRTIADQEGVEIEDQALEAIARASTGCARDAISLLDQLTAYGDQLITLRRLHQVLGLGDAQMVHLLVQHIVDHDVGAGLDVISRTAEQGADIRQFAQQVIEYLRNLLLMRVGNGESALDVDAQTHQNLLTLLDRTRVQDLVRWIRLFNQAQLDLRGSDRQQIALELAFVEAAMEEERTVPVERTVATPTAPEAPKPTPRTTVATRTVLPAAPPRSLKEGSDAAEREGAEQSGGDAGALAGQVLLDVQEISEQWPRIRQAIREQSKRVEALVNSAIGWHVQDGSQVVFELPSDLLSSKLNDDASRRVVEQAIAGIVGKPCRVRGVVHGTVPAAAPAETSHSARTTGHRGRAAPAEDAIEEPDEPEEPDLAVGSEESADSYQEAVSDPVVDYFVQRGGQVTDVQTLSEE